MLVTLFTLVAALAFQEAAAATVFAHFMVMNAYAYDVDQWITDMAAAADLGIDGFALNWTPPDCEPGVDWTVQAIDDAFTAAEQVGFKLMYSFDMSYSTCNIYWNQTFMQQMISQYAGNSATYRWNSNILVSTYGGDFVSEYGNGFFETLKNDMQYSNAITLAPALTMYSMEAQTSPQQAAANLISDFPSIDGYLDWQAWPLNVAQNMTVTADEAFSSALKNAGKTGPYIMAISPWQYKDLNDGNPEDTWVAYSDTLFADRFESIIGDDSFQPDIIELLTWNDFCESHYLRELPSETDEAATDYVELGAMGSYVWGQDHSPWQVMAKYYISWWKYGTPPAITEDQVIFWYRVHPKGAVCIGGSGEPVRNNMLPEDAVFAWALVKEPATISMSLGSNEYWLFEADSSGPSTGLVPFPLADLDGTGSAPQVAIMRNGALAGLATGPQNVSWDCAYQNFNPVVGLVTT